MTALRPKTARGVFPIKVFCIGRSGDLRTVIDAGGFISAFVLSRICQSNAGIAVKSGLRRLLLEFPFVRPSP